eukprot:3670212-Amphidinium_carterae.1
MWIFLAVLSALKESRSKGLGKEGVLGVLGGVEAFKGNKLDLRVDENTSRFRSWPRSGSGSRRLGKRGGFRGFEGCQKQLDLELNPEI